MIQFCLFAIERKKRTTYRSATAILFVLIVVVFVVLDVVPVFQLLHSTWARVAVGSWRARPGAAVMLGFQQIQSAPSLEPNHQLRTVEVS